MNITEKEIEHLAKLSNFSLEEKEAKALKSDLEKIIQYISELSELDTEKVKPTFQVFEMENIWRDDEIKTQDASRGELLELSPESQDNQVKVPKVL